MTREEQDKTKHLSGIGTRSVWAGERSRFMEGATQIPVSHSVAFAYENLEEWKEIAQGKREGHIYGRNSNPTVDVLEAKIRELEGAKAATSFATGMAAISNTLFALLKPGDRVVSQKDTYGGTSKVFLDYLPKFGVEVALCETNDALQMESEMRSGCTILYLESPTNPTLKILDLPRLCAFARNVGAVSVVDNTFATPINQNPLALGADLVVHSATKFLGGHSDALGGLAVGSTEHIQQIFAFREITGATLSPMAAYLLNRGMKTLELRMRRQNANALAIAEFLDRREDVHVVHYPGLPSHPSHELARRQMSGFGGVLSFTPLGGPERSAKILKGLNVAYLAAHLGGVETIAGPPATTSHVELNDEERADLGISENLIRYSAGIENIEDLIADLSAALDQSH